MALSLGISVGTQIRIASTHLLEVLDIQPKGNVSIRVDGKPFHVSSVERTEILPEVFVCFGAPPSKQQGGSGNRLAFEAPRSVRIERHEP